MGVSPWISLVSETLHLLPSSNETHQYEVVGSMGRLNCCNAPQDASNTLSIQGNPVTPVYSLELEIQSWPSVFLGLPPLPRLKSRVPNTPHLSGRIGICIRSSRGNFHARFKTSNANVEHAQKSQCCKSECHQRINLGK